MIRDYLNDSFEFSSNSHSRYSRSPSRKRRVLLIDEGVSNSDTDFYDIDNTKSEGREVLKKSRNFIDQNHVDRDLEEREFRKFKRDLQKSKEEYIIKENMVKSRLSKSKFCLYVCFIYIDNQSLERCFIEGSSVDGIEWNMVCRIIRIINVLFYNERRFSRRSFVLFIFEYIILKYII